MVIVAAIITKKSRAKVRVLQVQVMKLSTIYDEVAIDSKQEHNMEENMAYNVVPQEFQGTMHEI